MSPDDFSSKQLVNEKQTGMKFRPVLHALTSNPGVEVMDYAQGRNDMITLAQGEGDRPTPDFICDATMKAMKEGHTYYGHVLYL